ncbi:uncharacterized protein LOC103380880 isoform X2 [Cynoglossus semilaevis]|uniref:uncharacterized protein LOC103380880 isoform X2 n=1 Tax=Cynoglossus semilaevis TaxID=244447 RepID=UPI000D624A95|nr:uncharacterized protein LOC103380880 isoform X2 [Cynoglossus semilaevis]
MHLGPVFPTVTIKTTFFAEFTSVICLSVCSLLLWKTSPHLPAPPFGPTVSQVKPCVGHMAVQPRSAGENRLIISQCQNQDNEKITCKRGWRSKEGLTTPRWLLETIFVHQRHHEDQGTRRQDQGSRLFQEPTVHPAPDSCSRHFGRWPWAEDDGCYRDIFCSLWPLMIHNSGSAACSQVRLFSTLSAPLQENFPPKPTEPVSRR